MPHARNQVNGTRIYFEDEGGDGVPVAFLGRLLDSVAVVRDAKLAGPVPSEEFRRVFIDQRDLGRSDKPHETQFPKLVFTGAHSAASDAVVEVLAERLPAERVAIPGSGHGAQRTGAPFNERLGHSSRRPRWVASDAPSIDLVAQGCHRTRVVDRAHRKGASVHAAADRPGTWAPLPDCSSRAATWPTT
jgi:pimeloyl-ACP methyl ester carboxylesterase